MKILGIETSCDETAAGIVEDGQILLSNAVMSSMDLHAAYGGVVPEIAARSHIEAINPVINQALIEAKYGQAFGSDRIQGSNEQRTEPYKKYGEGAAQLMTPQSAENTFGKLGFAQLDKSMPNGLWDGIDGIAVTYGAGLGGSLLIGVLTARTLAIVHNKPLYAVNHVEGHVYANFLTSAGSLSPVPEQSSRLRESSLRDPALQAPLLSRSSSSTASSAALLRLDSHQSPADVKQWELGGQTYTLPSEQPEFPMLALIVSGGHSQLALFRNHFDYTLLGQTNDDAIGEAFDKVAKIIGLPYPGGPSIANKALEGNPNTYNFPKAKMASKYDFSFSGIKTAVLRTAQQLCGEDFTFASSKLPERLSEAQKTDIAASFQRVAIETVADKTLLAYEEFKPKSVVIAGGVAASQELRRQLSERLPLPIQYTDPKLCTDNGAMIATLGCYKALLDQPQADPYTLDIKPNLSM